ncbi:ABC transporter C family member 5 isoform X2 [Physcomitrium patens]|uniref:ABC transporter C family member 5 isoform X2 n=1 Tax=Physcomitrium patens TaxID=3218 RepID=UPI003CCCE2DC
MKRDRNAELEDKQPLLDGKGSEAETSVTPYATAGFFSLATISWLNPLLAEGYRKHLELKDLQLLAPESRATKAYGDFKESWNWLKIRNPNRARTLIHALMRSLWKEGVRNAAFAMVNVLATYVGPYLINDFVNYVAGRQRYAHQGYTLILIFFFAKVTENLSNRQWYLGSMLLGLKIKASLVAFIYEKGLRLSSQSRRVHTSAEIINYMAVDVQRVADFTWSINHFWILPLQIALALFVLHRVVGIAWTAALVAACVLLLINTPLTKLQEKYQGKVMEAKDERMKVTSEVLRNMRILKLQAWDKKYFAKIEAIRVKEMSWLWKKAVATASTVYLFWTAPVLVSTATFATCVIMKIPLSAGQILTALATFRILQDPLDSFPEFISNLTQTKVSLDRLWKFLHEEELATDAVERVPKAASENALAISIKSGNFNWNPDVVPYTLTNVNLQVRAGSRVAICGMVGSGKTSLISCILGEIPVVSGMVKVAGSIAYVAQSAWIQSGTIEQNILFGSDMDRLKYEAVLLACALKKDLELFAYGDQTEIGERGINLSGGQKQRVQLARALYQDADIYLLDDPFSAVDAHTGTYLFNEYVMRALRNKTLIYVTHQMEFLPQADLILSGKYEELILPGTSFSAMIHAHQEAISSINTASKNNAVADSENNRNHLTVKEKEILKDGNPLLTPKNMKVDDNDQKFQLVQDEERERGKVAFAVYWSYITCVCGGLLVILACVAQCCFVTCQILSNYWMAWATSPKQGRKSPSPLNLISVYTGLAFGSTFFIIVRSLLVEYVGLRTAQQYFLSMMRCLFRAPMSFFDSTPAGRILNRTSSDQSELDWEVYHKFNGFMVTTVSLVGTLIVMSQVGLEILLLFAPVFVACISMQRYYMASARELQRVKSIQHAPIIHHYGESIAGAVTIRGFRQEKRFMTSNVELYDKYMRPSFYSLAAIQWLVFRMELLTTLVFSSCMLLVIWFPSKGLDSGLAGLAVTYGLSLNSQQSWWVWCLCDVENKIIKVERIQQYTKIPPEPPLVIRGFRPPRVWPTEGMIILQNLQVRYSENLPMVLHGVTCTFWGGKKVGVVGRTGSGKSTLIQALFRMVDPVAGRIIIDGLDISTIGLHDLRSRLSIIPQDPTLFEGSVRANLDPLGEHSDAEVWQALDKCKLGDTVRGKEGKLSSLVEENGENWSVGQRQLVCLGRALLKRTRILVLDEATASVDTATDNLIQQTLRVEFSNCTVVTIAHRIPTVIDSDRVLVLSDGRVSEYDEPKRLLEDKSSFFSGLVAEYATRSSTGIV